MSFLRGSCSINVALVLFVLGCGYRLPVQEGSDDAYVSFAPDSFQGDTALPIPDGPSCKAARRLVAGVSDSRGNFVVAGAKDTHMTPVYVPNASSKTSAMALDRHSVSGFVLTIPFSGDILTAMDTLRSRISARFPILVRSSGTKGLSKEKNGAVKEAMWRLTLPTGQSDTVGQIRNQVMSLMSNRSKLPNLPRGSEVRSSGFIIELTTEMRTGQLLISAGVATQQAFDLDQEGTRALIDDFGNGTAVASVGHRVAHQCPTRQVTQSNKKADIIWVIDESGSTNDNRDTIVANAERFFATATAAGLDFRMGVTGMIDPNKGVPGAFCSTTSSTTDHNGGVDRFLSPNEKSTFSGCVRNPPFRVASREFGLAGAYRAVTRHLPRADSPAKIRKGAKLVLVLVTDEAPQELKTGTNYEGKTGFLTSSDYKKGCNLSATKQKQLDSYIAPWIALFTGQTNIEAKATVHLIAGSCGSQCQADIPHGYSELVHATGGQTADICQKDLGPTIQLIINDIAAATSPGKLDLEPISASLAVVIDDQPLRRSRQQGFGYSAVNNALTFYNMNIKVGTTIVASYSAFVK